MRRAELRDELERLGSRPVPLPDSRRVDAIEDRLYQEFVVSPTSSRCSALLEARRRRRLVLIAGLGAAAAATVAVVVLDRGSTPAFELQSASGAVALFPDGQSRPVHAGDQVPPGGLIQTGPAGGVTIAGTKIGPDQVVLLSDEGLTLLPARTPPTATTDAGRTIATTPATAGRPSATTAPPAVTDPSTATSPATAAPPASPVVAPVDPVASTTTPETGAPAPAVFTQPLGQFSLTVGADTGGVRLAWPPSDADDFGRYVVTRGTAADHELTELADLGDRQLTSFTDGAAPHDVALLYRVVVMSADGRPLAASDVVELTLDSGSATSTPTSVAPPTSDGSGTGQSVPPTTDGSGTGQSVPPATVPGSTSVPRSTTTNPATSTTAASTTTSAAPSAPADPSTSERVASRP